MDEITTEIVDQIAQVRKGGETNMMDRNTVQVIANDLSFFALVVWIEFNKNSYFKLLEELGKVGRNELDSPNETKTCSICSIDCGGAHGANNCY